MSPSPLKSASTALVDGAPSDCVSCGGRKECPVTFPQKDRQVRLRCVGDDDVRFAIPVHIAKRQCDRVIATPKRSAALN